MRFWNLWKDTPTCVYRSSIVRMPKHGGWCLSKEEIYSIMFFRGILLELCTIASKKKLILNWEKWSNSSDDCVWYCCMNYVVKCICVEYITSVWYTWWYVYMKIYVWYLPYMGDLLWLYDHLWVHHTHIHMGEMYIMRILICGSLWENLYGCVYVVILVMISCFRK